MDVHLMCRFCGQVDKNNHGRNCVVGKTEDCSVAWENHCERCCDAAKVIERQAMKRLEADMVGSHRNTPHSGEAIKLNPAGKGWREFDWCEDLAFHLTGCTREPEAMTKDGIRVAWSTFGIVAWRPEQSRHRDALVVLAHVPHAGVNLALFRMRAVKDFGLSEAEQNWLDTNCWEYFTIPDSPPPAEVIDGVRFVTYNDSPNRHTDEITYCAAGDHKGSIVVHGRVTAGPQKGLCTAQAQRIGEKLRDVQGTEIPKESTCTDGWRLAFAFAEKHGWPLLV